jgi:glycosyltransferase involved in cell wall biosynthesis
VSGKPSVSVVIGARNEHPVLLGTIYSLVEELDYWGYPWEVVVVDNLSTDSTADVLEDRMRRWVEAGRRESAKGRFPSGGLKVLKHDVPANVTVRNIGARAASGDVLVICDAHVSVKTGTLHGMVRGWQAVGGLWHSAINIWGDTSDIRCYGYDLKLEQKFWGNLCHGIPKEIAGQSPRPAYRVPMASHCLLVAGREEYLAKRGYNENFRCYGGGEPYLDLKWWLLGGEVWIYPEGLVRHAFGTEATWRKLEGRRDFPNRSWLKGKGLSKVGEEGDEVLHYSRGYSWNNEQLHHNFMLSAFTVGGYGWLQRIYDVYRAQRAGNVRYLEDLNEERRGAIQDGMEDREWIAARQKCSLDELLVKAPWNDHSRLHRIEAEPMT